MSTFSNQAEANHMQVVVEQVMADSVLQADSWAKLGRKAKIEAWIEWLQTPAPQRSFLRFDRVLQVIEEVD